MDQITVLSLLNFTDAQLDKLRVVSPRLNVQQLSGATVEEYPQELVDNTEILYGWGSLLAQAHTLPRLKWIQTHSAGIDSLQKMPIWEMDVLISSMNGIHAIPITEHAMAMIMAFRWRIPTMLQFKSRSEWAPDRWDNFARPELRGSTLGIIGYGAIGRELARQAKALGMRVLAVNSSGKRTPFRGYSIPDVGDPQAEIPDEIYATQQMLDILPECDYVVAAAPLTSQTHYLISVSAFEKMKPTAFFFNVGRGPVVDEAALIEALQQGKIAGAGLDVFEKEPLPADSPLWAMDNVIISPHVSGFTPLYDERATDVFAENLRRYLKGETLLNLVNKERGY